MRYSASNARGPTILVTNVSPSTVNMVLVGNDAPDQEDTGLGAKKGGITGRPRFFGATTHFLALELVSLR